MGKMEPPPGLQRVLERFFSSAAAGLSVDRGDLERLWRAAWKEASPGREPATCVRVLSRGPRAGLPCGGRTTAGSQTCRRHQARTRAKTTPPVPGKQKMVFRPLAGSPDILVNDRTGFVIRSVKEGVLGKYSAGEVSRLSGEDSLLCGTLGLSICGEPPPLDSLLLQS